MSEFPDTRLRRLREQPAIRSMIRETRLTTSSFVYPMFIRHGSGIKETIDPMPGCYHISLDLLAEEAQEVYDLGIPAVLLFGLPADKDPLGTEAYDPEGIIQEAIRIIKKATPDLMVIGDVCLCEYTDHGHCGIINENQVDNDQTLDLLGKTGLAQIQAGADMVAPSAMMDGQVRAIRETLDSSGYSNSPIMGYAAKYASSFYGPFRVAADSTPQFGDRRTYQMDPANARMAMREIETDISEGADIVMVKPALAYLDVIRQARDRFDLPLAAYNVSGEYSLVKAASKMGWVDEKPITMELLTAIQRAGADIIISYHAKEVAKWLREE
ncbi:MAG: delta-aminolevulinic acid dehydratase [Dehalococcoidia bacterium]|nr:MAG: delta-aminolevulinic acid dehydratase [Dehalococcoidia bacterium]